MVLDWIILIVMLVGLIGGIIKGVIQQIFSLGGLVLGIVLGTLLYEPFADLLLSSQCKRHGFGPSVGKILWRKARQPTPVFLPEKSHRQRSLAGYSPWGRKELDTT